jgi:hypothetical protein
MNTAYYDKGEIIYERQMVLKNYFYTYGLKDLTCIVLILFNFII